MVGLGVMGSRVLWVKGMGVRGWWGIGWGCRDGGLGCGSLESGI